MKAEIKPLLWDTEFFGKKIGEICLNHSANIITDQDFDLIVIKQNQDLEVKINGYKRSFLETKIIFSKKLSAKNCLPETEIKDTDQNHIGWEDFKVLAYESGKMSRFLLDPNFGEDYFIKLYNEWIINSLNKKFATKTFYISDEDKPISFVTLQKNENIGRIGLIATLPGFQGKGFGKKLLLFAENYAMENCLNAMEIPTQEENQQACRFYEKLGYSIKEKIIIKHFWKI